MEMTPVEFENCYWVRECLFTHVFIPEAGYNNSRGLRYRGRTTRILLVNEENAQSKGQLVSL